MMSPDERTRRWIEKMERDERPIVRMLHIAVLMFAVMALMWLVKLFQVMFQ